MNPQPMQPGQHLQQAQEPSWFSRNWKWLLALGCLVPTLCCGGFGLVTWFGVQKVIKEGPVYAESLAKAVIHPEVAKALGEPVKPGGMVSGNVSDNGGSGTASLKVPLEGPKGKGTLYVEASKSAGQWNYTKMEVELADGKRIDLLAGAPQGQGPSPFDDIAPDAVKLPGDDEPLLPQGDEPAPADDAPPPGDEAPKGDEKNP